MKQLAIVAACMALGQAAIAADTELHKAVARDYQQNLAPLFEHFHRNPELSFMEFKTAARLAQELRAAGLQVTEGVGGTGVVAILKNGPGPTVMLRADMDGLPMEEKSGLPYAANVVLKDREGNAFPVAHSCGHDVHITSLVGTAHQMVARKAEWSGTLMLIGQPAEERVGGALAMMKDRLWDRFGKPDFALAFHVSSLNELGKLEALEGAPYSGADAVDVIVHGVGAHGASPHTGKDPIVIASQIVLGLQALVSRDLAPREPGVITVGSFHAGTKANIISDRAELKLTVRSENPKTRKLLLDGIRRVALNTARAAGVAEDQLPEVREVDDPAPPTVNDVPLARRLKAVWVKKMGADVMDKELPRLGMGAEDFPGFTTTPYIPSVYFRVGGTPKAVLDAADAGGPPVPSHHSPLFKVVPEESVRTGVEASVLGLLELMKKK